MRNILIKFNLPKLDISDKEYEENLKEYVEKLKEKQGWFWLVERTNQNERKMETYKGL